MTEDKTQVLIADADAEWVRRVCLLLERAGLPVADAPDFDAALETLAGTPADIIVVGFDDPESVTRARIEKMVDLAPGGRFIGLMDEPDEKFEYAVRKAGFHDFLPRDIPQHQLIGLIKRYGEMHRIQELNAHLRTLLECRNSFESLLGGSAPMKALYKLIEQVSRADAPVLITGESGSEFEEVARSVHQHSPRAPHALLVIDCAEGEPGEVEREIFGPVGRGTYAKGPSLDGSMFARAGEGSLLLKNIDVMSAAAQDRLMEFLRTPFFQGETSATAQPITRIMGASGANLPKEIEGGRFDRELYYRLNILQIRVPPLRDRKEDIPMLVEYCLQNFNATHNARNNRPPLTFGSEAMLQLFQYGWPGNVDELVSSVMDAAGRAKTLQVGLEHLPAAMVQVATEPDSDAAPVIAATIPLRQAKRHFETAYFRDLLRRTGGNMTAASKISKVGRPYLYKKIKEYEIEPNEYR